MSTVPDRHTRRRLATRQRISDIATRLFAKNGFDAVTIDAIAEAADVGRMTVFNHFARKEDLFFDREPEIRGLLRETLGRGDPAHPLESLRQLAHRLVEKDAAFLRFSEQSQGFVTTLVASETLKARARALRDEMAEEICRGMAKTLARPLPDPGLSLAAALVVAGWTTAFTEAMRNFAETGNRHVAQILFLSLIDTGTMSALYALRHTSQ